MLFRKKYEAEKKRRENDLKARFLVRRENLLAASGKTHGMDGSPGREELYSPAMLEALRDMAKEDVFPDGRFSSTDAIVWSMFR